MRDQVFGTKMNIWFNQFAIMSDNFMPENKLQAGEVCDPALKVLRTKKGVAFSIIMTYNNQRPQKQDIN